jgi:hypothetical protein
MVSLLLRVYLLKCNFFLDLISGIMSSFTSRDISLSLYTTLMLLKFEIKNYATRLLRTLFYVDFQGRLLHTFSYTVGVLLFLPAAFILNSC